MLLMIDNYDSFTYTLVNYLEALDVEVCVVKNDAIDVAGIQKRSPDYLMISPGPCTPNEAGVSLAAIRAFAGKIPLLGVCLGHQAIAQVFGATVTHAASVMHGKTSSIYHQGRGVFAGLPSPYTATRYHSLSILQSSLPSEFDVSAWTQNEKGEREEIMAIQHRSLPIHGVQFHPESVLTEHGMALLKNFLDSP